MKYNLFASYSPFYGLKYQSCILKSLGLCFFYIFITNYSSFSQTPRPVPAAYTSTDKINYIRAWEALAPDQDPAHLITRSVQDVQQTTNYFDGLGRPIETVIKGITPAGNDLVTPPVVYDNIGREQFQYLPFSSNIAQAGDVINDGNFKLDPYQQQASFYNTTQILQNQAQTFYYSQVNYEPSPLNRVTSAYPAGNSWVGAGKGPQQQYFTNTSPDNVQRWNLTASYTNIPNTTAPVPTNGGAYPSGTLYKKITIDESNNKVVEYKDKEGKIILKQVQSVAAPSTNHAGWLNTYYIYDNLNNLRYILQPQAVQLLLNNATWDLSSISNLLTGLCFYYEYDQRNRMIIKRIPGAQPVYMVYDERDRLIMSQDGNLRSLGKWLVTVYENSLDRPVQTGLLTSAISFGTHISNAYHVSNYPSTASGFELLTQTFYDNYSWQTGTPLSSGFDAAQGTTSNNFYTSSDVSYPYPCSVTRTAYTTIGMVTGLKKEILGTSNYIYSANYYDDHDRVIQTQSTNITNIASGVDETTNQFAFDGKILVSRTRNIKSGTNAQTNTIQSQNNYDNAGRLTSTAKTIIGTVGTFSKTIATNTYNELGQLKDKTFGPTASVIDKLTYDYNIRGWLLGINRNYINSATTIGATNLIPSPGNYFGEELAYDKLNSVSGMPYTAAQLNGNVAGTVWKSTGDAINRKYDFTYDNANRLTAANFSQLATGYAQALDFTVNNLQYDANGNILFMNQKGYRLGAPTSLIDQLTYTYLPASNQLKNVFEATGVNNPQTILGDFRSSQAYMTALGGNKTNAAFDYSYDNNGNLTTDQNKDIGLLNNSNGALVSQGITYNYLNLPQLITLNNNKGTIKYIYDAAGNKLQKITTENSATVIYNGTTYTGVAITTTTTYISGFVYQSIAYPNNATLNASTLQHGDILQFAGHEEGRIRGLYDNTTNSNTLTGYAFDYFIKDHLGNTRIVLTDEVHTDPLYKATMETGNGTAEQQVFSNISQTRVPKPAGFDTDTPNQSVALTNFTGNKIGPSLILKVMAGDQLSIQTQAYYLTTSGNNNNVGTIVANDLLNSLTSGLSGMSGSHATATDLQNNSTTLNSSSLNFLNNRTAPNTGVPKAYLNYLFLDDQFQYAGGYASPVTSASATQAVAVYANLYPVTAPKNGYVYVFVSNESNYNVYFDNLQVSFKRGPILEDNAYYPFGLQMAGISDKALKYNYSENKNRFGGKELQSKEFSDGSGLELIDFGAREQDPQLGRWWTIDPMTIKTPEWTPYRFSYDNPYRFIDLDGKREFSSYERYEKYAKRHKVEVLPADKIGSQGHWLKSDRVDNTNVWKGANVFNLKQAKGYEEYRSISQRADFYGWFQESSNEKGNETKWAGAASEIAHNIDYLTNGFVKFLGYSNDELENFAEEGNAKIFNDVFGKLDVLYFGEPKKGDDAVRWDAMALSQEQHLIQPLYEGLSNESLGLVSALSKQLLIGVSSGTNIPPFPKNYSILNISQRWEYGMRNMEHNVNASQMPNPGIKYEINDDK